MNLICFSHLRWNFVFQRPQHLLSRFAKHSRVFYIEEPLYHNDNDNYQIQLTPENVWVITPQLDISNKENMICRQQKIVDHIIRSLNINEYICWYYTPMVLPFTRHLKPGIIVYDCMDELSNFKFAPPEIKKLEQELMKKADIVFTGGYSLYEAKRNHHHNIYPFPSSIDKAHFAKARIKNTIEPDDQKNIPYPRIGFCGVIDERLDIELLEKVAEKRPDLQLILIGPVVKIEESSLPQKPNIHYLGSKSYDQLPSYIKGWNVAMIPFAINDATKYISPTKTPEYLAAGKPVISTPIRDVVHPYGTGKFVHIINSAEEFVDILEKELSKKPQQKKEWLNNVDHFLSNSSWDKTWSGMVSLIDQVRQNNIIVADTVVPLQLSA